MSKRFKRLNNGYNNRQEQPTTIFGIQPEESVVDNDIISEPVDTSEEPINNSITPEEPITDNDSITPEEPVNDTTQEEPKELIVISEKSINTLESVTNDGTASEEPVVDNVTKEPITTPKESVISNDDDSDKSVTDNEPTTIVEIGSRQYMLHQMKCKLSNGKQLEYKPIQKDEEAYILKNYSLMKFGRLLPLEVLMTSIPKRKH